MGLGKTAWKYKSRESVRWSDSVNRRDGVMGSRVWTRGSPSLASLREVSNEKISAG